MTIALKIILSIVIVLVIMGIISYIHNHKKLPSEFFSESYNRMMVKAQDYRDIIANDTDSMYQKIGGHANNEKTKALVKRLKKKEHMYKKNQKNKKFSEKYYGDAINSAFILGNIMQYNMQDEQQARKYYSRVIERVRQAPLAADEGIWQTETLAERAMENLNVGVEERREVITNIARARRTTKPNPVKIRSDPQNVHDSALNQQLKKKLRLMKNENSDLDLEAVEADMMKVISGHKKSAELNAVITAMYPTMALEKSVDALNSTEKDVLLHTWGRSLHSDNEQNSESVKTAIIDAMLSCKENDSLVCASGRCARILESLVLIDSHADISKSGKTKEILRSEIFSKCALFANEENPMEKINEMLKSEYPEADDLLKAEIQAAF